MSMLAEQRKKANWVLNPRNTHWTADTSKFGQRLMEKMGWTEGSGLGANKQGSTEHIKVSVRSDNRGVGYMDRPEDELVHQSAFSDLLRQLASDTPPLEGPGDRNDSARVSSLEEKSQMSRSRVHYRKFTRGKDLSRYSEKDLANIIGKPAYVNSVKNTTSVEGRNNTKFESDVNTIGGGDMYDYFRKKMSGNGLKEKRGEPSNLEEIGTQKGMNEMNGTDDNFVETRVGKKDRKAKRVSKDAQQSDATDSDSEARKERKQRRKAQKQLKNPEEVMKSDDEINAKNEKGPNFKLELLSASKSCEEAVEYAADGAETKKERKRKRRAERALKNSEQQLEVEGEASVKINLQNNNVKESKLKLKSLGEDNGQVGKNDKNMGDAEAFAGNKKEKKRWTKVQRALHKSQEKTELEITTNLMRSSNDKEIPFLAPGGTEHGEENDKARVNKKEKQKKNKKTCKEAQSAEINFKMCVESEAADIGTEVTQTSKPKKARKELNPETADLEEQNDEVNYTRIKSKKGLRKSQHLRKSQVETEMPHALEVGHPQVFCDTRSRKAKKKEKKQNLTELSEQPELETSDKLAGISSTEIEYSILMKNEKILEHNDRKAQNSETSKEAVTIFNENIVCAVKKRENGRKRKRNETPSSETLEGTFVLNEEVECAIKPKRVRKGKRDDKDIAGLETLTETVDGLNNEIECTAEKRREKKHKRKDREIAHSSVEEKHVVSDENTELSEEFFSEGQNYVIQDVVDHEDLRKDFVGAEKVVIDAVDAKLNIQENLLEKNMNLTSKNETEADEQARSCPQKKKKQIFHCSSGSITVTESADATEDDNTTKKHVSIVKLGGKVYINGICNFDLVHPEINDVQLKKIPVHLREDVRFLPFSGSNVQDFGYIGLNFKKKL